jgi:hypothetical protein
MTIARRPEKQVNYRATTEAGATDRAVSRRTIASMPLGPFRAVDQWLTRCLHDAGRGIPAPGGPAPDDWSAVLATAERHGLGAALGWAVRARGDVPAAVRAAGERQLAHGAARHLLMTNGLVQVLRACAADGIPVIPLKGPALAEALYPHPGMRPCNDVDVLVRPADVRRADGVLRRLGYASYDDAHSWDFDLAYDHATLYERTDGVRLDLHWRLLNDPRYTGDVDAGIWDRATEQEIAGLRARVLGREDVLLYLAVHLAVHHALDGLVWYWDLALLVDRWRPEIDWQAVVTRALAGHVRRALFHALAGLHAMFGVSAPTDAMARLAVHGPRAAFVGWLLRHAPASRLEYLLPLLLIDRARDLPGVVRAALVPPPRWVRARYGGNGSLARPYLTHYRRLGHIVRGGGPRGTL